MDASSSTEELVAIEKVCLDKFQEKARAIRAANPVLSREIAYAKAVQLLPKTANRYQLTRELLAERRVRCLPLVF
jgi:hypothetical protein